MGKTFAKEVLEIHANWEGKEFVSMRIKELMIVIQIGVTALRSRFLGSQIRNAENSTT